MFRLSGSAGSDAHIGLLWITAVRQALTHRPSMNPIACCLALLIAMLASAVQAADRFAKIVDEGGDPTVTAGGFVVNQKRVAVQKELTARPPTAEELGVRLPAGAKLMLVETARQIAQYHPAWRIYQYRVELPREAVVAHFEAQGLKYDVNSANLKFGNAGGDFVDGLSQSGQHQLRVWRKPN